MAASLLHLDFIPSTDDNDHMTRSSQPRRTAVRRSLVVVASLVAAVVLCIVGVSSVPPTAAFRTPLQRRSYAIKADHLTKKTTLAAKSGNPAAKQKNVNGARKNATAVDGSFDEDDEFGNNVDAMRARAGLLRASILRQQLELQRLERKIACCAQPAAKAFSIDQTLSSFDGLDPDTADEAAFDPSFQAPVQALTRAAQQTLTTFVASTNVLLRKLRRVQLNASPTNRRWNGNVAEYVATQTATGARIVQNLVREPERLKQLIDPATPTLVPHLPSIIARLDKLEGHVNPILERVLNNRRHLPSIEPYLDEILERFDDIEPHLPWILDNIDALAPYTGLLLKHIDELLLYADVDAHEGSESYDLAEQLLPYLEFYVSRLDVVGPHLPLLRPHIPRLLKYDRIAKISPHIDRLFARGYRDLSASANLDILLFWFGWSLRVPFLPWLFFAFPGSPRIVSFLANRLPKRFVRGYCAGVRCQVDGDYGSDWNRLSKA